MSALDVIQVANPVKPQWTWVVRDCEFRLQDGQGTFVPQTQDISSQTPGEFVPVNLDHRGFVTDDDPKYQTLRHAYDERSFVLSVDSQEIITLKFTKTGTGYELSSGDLLVYDGCRTKTSCQNHQPTPIRPWDPTTEPSWGSSSAVGYANKTFAHPYVLIVRALPGDYVASSPVDWSMEWTTSWTLDYTCKSTPPPYDGVLMGPAEISERGVMFVSVEKEQCSGCQDVRRKGHLTVKPSDRVVIYGDIDTAHDSYHCSSVTIIANDNCLHLPVFTI
jgi:hypothetical protein